MYQSTSIVEVSDDSEVETWAAWQAAQHNHSDFGQQGWAEVAYQELHKVVQAHYTMLWLTKHDVMRKMAPVVADTALRLAIPVKKLGKFATVMHNNSGFNKGSSDCWLLLEASVKHCGVFCTVVSVPSD